ncbi:MAG: hypothetical protein IKZ54_11455 [Bacteroidales bacterium]|nr:hypothetical protein [Bacteroidales bacterium]
MKLTAKVIPMLLMIVWSALTISCNRGEGPGGTGSIEGTVYMVLHPDDNYNLETDTVLAAKEDVFLVYGTQQFYGDDEETDHTGFYQFKYLRPGTYTVYAYSTLANGERTAVSQTVEVQRGKTTTAPIIYIHEGKAYGTSIVKGHVWAYYIDKNGNVISQGWAYGQRMYIQRQGEDFPCDDVRVGIDGVFAFQKLSPGYYTVFTFGEDEDEIPSVVSQNISVTEADQIYWLSDTMRVNVKP